VLPEIKPNVVLPIYAITNPVGKFFTTPQPISKGAERPVDETAATPFLDQAAELVSEKCKDYW
jgi:hypothetical protein